MYYFKSAKGLILRALTYVRTKWCEMVWRKEVGGEYNKRELTLKKEIYNIICIYI